MRLTASLSTLVGNYPMITIARALAPLALIWSVAWPEYSHFRIDHTPPSSQIIKALALAPPVNVLDELANMNLAVSLGISPTELPQTARNVLNGQLDAPAFLTGAAPLTGWPGDLYLGGQTFQLVIASLAVEEVLLEEFERTQDRSFYRMARDRMLSFAQWEGQQTQPIAFLWNDHAVAARIPVLIHLWRHLRMDHEATPEQHAELIALVERSGRLLAKDSQFTVRTNHGVMQNIALLQISAGFPAITESQQWRTLAMKRLELQLGFYVSEEGAILEHSAEYHVFGNELLALAARLAYLNELPLPARLVEALPKATAFSEALLRPDGTLPAFGNTVAGHPTSLIVADEYSTQPVTKRSPPFPPQTSKYNLFPVSGYAIWWNEGQITSQTLIAWAKHDRHGHKHADEPSVQFWSKGYDWITGTGYWPYGAPNFSDAIGWRGSNAPHLLNEKANSPRTNRLLGTGESNGVRFIELENRRDNGFSVRRQIVQINAETLLILDFTDKAPDEIETLWTLDPRVHVSPIGKNTYIGKIEGETTQIEITFTSFPADALDVTTYRGSRQPFAGWVVTRHHPTAADALMTRQNIPNGVIGTLVRLQNDSPAPVVRLHEYPRSMNWKISAVDASGTIEVERDNNSIAVMIANQQTNLTVALPVDISLQVNNLRQAMTTAIEAYPPWRNLNKYTLRLYVAVGLLWLCIEVVLIFTRRNSKVWKEMAPLIGWIAVAWWVHRFYLI